MSSRRGCGGPGQPPSQDQPATGQPPGDRTAPATGEQPAGGPPPAGGDADPGHGATTLTAASTGHGATTPAAASTGQATTPAAASTGHATTPAAARARPGPLVTALAGLREPIVVILLLIAFFTWISGKSLDGLLMLVVAVCLAWDTGRRRTRQDGPPEGSPAGNVPQDVSAAAGRDDDGSTGPATHPDTPTSTASRRRRLLLLAWLAGGALYVVLVGSFSRYSWPATVPVAALGAVVVVAGWRGPRHSRPAPARLPAIGLALWGLVLVAGCLWELSSLFQQPTLATSSYAHPTISTLTDPVLSTWAGRSIFLAAWLGLGWFLVER